MASPAATLHAVEAGASSQTVREAEAVILELVRVVLGDKRRRVTDNGLMTTIVRGGQHTPRCPRGQWLQPNGPRPDGDPCSDRCVAAWAAIHAAARWLMDNEQPAAPAQAGLWEEVAG